MIKDKDNPINFTDPWRIKNVRPPPSTKFLEGGPHSPHAKSCPITKVSVRFYYSLKKEIAIPSHDQINAHDPPKGDTSNPFGKNFIMAKIYAECQSRAPTKWWAPALR